MAQELKLTPENEVLQPHGSVEIAQSKTIYNDSFKSIH